MSKFHIFGGDWVIQPVKTEKLRGSKLFYPPGSSLTRQARIWGSFRVFFLRVCRTGGQSPTLARKITRWEKPRAHCGLESSEICGVAGESRCYSLHTCYFGD